jgi:intracellular septation protein A
MDRVGSGFDSGLSHPLIRTTLSQSPIDYFAPPVIINAAYGLAFLVSVVHGRPLAGLFATETCPFPREVRATVPFRRTFTHISLAWGAYLLFRSLLRLVVLLNFSVDVCVALTAASVTVGLMAWSF